MALTDKQEMFCREYLVDLNATQAAIRAGYSDKTARSQANRMLTNVDIEKRIQELMSSRSEQLKVDADYVLKRLVEIDQMDVADILLSNGEIKPIKDWPKVWRITLSGIDVTEVAGDAAGLLKKIKWPDKMKNLELLGKHISVQAFIRPAKLTKAFSRWRGGSARTGIPKSAQITYRLTRREQ